MRKNRDLIMMDKPKSQKSLYIGIFLTLATISSLLLLSTDSLAKNNSARYVTSFVTGLFGFTAIEMLRRSLDE